jgi:hypothetical protein
MLIYFNRFCNRLASNLRKTSGADEVYTVKIPFSILLLTLIAFEAQTHFAQTATKAMPKAKTPAIAASKYVCLPAEIEPDTIIETRRIKSRVGVRLIKETAVQRLTKLNARCRAGKLFDGKGREIRFYQLEGCWGNPPPDHLEIVARQERELQNLKKKFTVIEVTCNPTGVMPF